MRLWWVLWVVVLAACSKVECGEGTVRVENRCEVVPVDGGASDGAAPSVCDSADDCPARANTVAACEANTCRYACATGYADCDAIADNGCEADLASAATCGTCTTSCTDGPPNTVGSCEAGGCSYACGDDWGDCDGNPLSGCESSLANAVNCLGCGMSCPSSLDWCLDGACRSPVRRAGFVTDSTISVGGTDIVALDDGGFILFGRFVGSMVVLGMTHDSGGNASFVMRVEAGGAVRWFQPLGSAQVRAAERDGESIVVAGTVAGARSLGPFTIGVAGSSDLFVARLSADGVWTAARSYGSVLGSEIPQSIAVTSTGVFVAGTFEFELDFGFDVLTVEFPYEHGFVLALDAALEPVRQLHFAPEEGDIESIAVAASPDGAVAVAGSHQRALTIGSTRLEAPFQTYISRWTSALELEWAQGVPVGGELDDIRFRSDGDLLAAYHRGGLEGSRVPTPRAYLLRYDEAGALVEARDLGGTIQAMSITVTGDDTAYVVGTARAYDFGTPVALTLDGVLIGTAPSGAPTWHRAFSGSEDTWLEAVDVSPTGEVFVLGLFQERVFDGAAPPLTTPRTQQQTFVRSYVP